MKFSFEAKIDKVGINPCVEVPFGVTAKMKSVKGYIRVKGEINTHPFKQTLVPVKGAEHRLYVNAPMLKGGNAAVGDTAKFVLEPDTTPRKKKNVSMVPLLKKKLILHKLSDTFDRLTASRKKDILSYLNSLKTDEALKRNVEKVITQLKKQKTDPDKSMNVRIP
jgi:hypothetical protein